HRHQPSFPTRRSSDLPRSQSVGLAQAHRTGEEAMNDRDFVAAFEACEVANTDFHHADHVRVAWFYVRTYPLIEAIERFTTSLQRSEEHTSELQSLRHL